MTKSVVEASSLLAYYWDRHRKTFFEIVADNDPMDLLKGFVKHIPLDSPRVGEYAEALQILQTQLPEGEPRKVLQAALKPYVENIGKATMEAVTAVQQVDF